MEVDSLTLKALSLPHFLWTLCEALLVISYFLLILRCKSTPSAQEIDQVKIECFQKVERQEDKVIDQLDDTPAGSTVRTGQGCLSYSN